MKIRALAAAVATPRGGRIAIVVVLVLAALTWWWYPALSDESADTDVAIIGDSFLQSAVREITQRIHEDGFSLVWAVGGGPSNETEATSPSTTTAGVQPTWCDAPSMVRDQIRRHHPAIIVISLTSEG